MVASEQHEQLLKQADVKDILRVSDATLEAWRQKGRGPAFIKVEGSVRYRLSDVQRYLASLQPRQSTKEVEKAA